ncbi:hypothetical protein [Mongoliimonas terrestris]|uniref:hypothetical protein n=1 Tax=Mongoliimonas terrestris TaxID=1709001 RepID=UPI0009495796|nr:hypothetical protein [Mongoliimonas terrestris]
MIVPIEEAQIRLADLVERARRGEDVRLGATEGAVVRLVPVITCEAVSAFTPRPVTPEEIARRRRLLDEIARSASAKARPGPDAARSQDFLYDEYGLPG